MLMQLKTLERTLLFHRTLFLPINVVLPQIPYIICNLLLEKDSFLLLFNHIKQNILSKFILIRYFFFIHLLIRRFGFHQIQEVQKCYLPEQLKLSQIFTCVDCGVNPMRFVSQKQLLSSCCYMTSNCNKRKCFSFRIKLIFWP